MTVGVAFEKDVLARGGNDEIETPEVEAHPTQKRHALRRDGVRQGIGLLPQSMLISLAPVDAAGILLLRLRVDFAGKTSFPTTVTRNSKAFLMYSWTKLTVCEKAASGTSRRDVAGAFCA